MRKLFFILMMFGFILCGCNKTETSTQTPTQNKPEGNVNVNPYIPTDTILSFSDELESKIITESTYDVSQYTKDAGSDIKPYKLFGDGMCLQRDAINRIWGKASKTGFIAAEINGQVYYGTIKSREWEIYLPKMNAGGPYELAIISESGRFVIKNVYIGEVYLCSGQSNMEFRPQDAGTVLEDLYSSGCENDKIRMLNLPVYNQEEPTIELVNQIKWSSANQNTIKAFSAVGYIFGKKMQEELDCPIGLISAAVGGTSIEFWLSQENVGKLSYKPFIDQSSDYNKLVMTPSLGYNGMLYPLSGLNVRGVVWYQGCSNAFGTEKYYDGALKIFMEQCRDMFNNKQLSFTVCELARFGERPMAYSTVNEKINAVAKEDKYMVVARNVDLGDWNDIHPKDKHEIGNRAAEETLRVFFKKNIAEPVNVKEYSFNSDGSVTINLSCDAKLVNGKNGFEVNVNGKYTYDCTVTIDGNKITVKANGEITSVRYGYTCEMSDEIKADVSKMVTVYDNNGNPLDLFLISK